MFIEKIFEGTIEKNEKDENKMTVTFAHVDKEDYDGDLFQKGSYDLEGNVHHGRWDHKDGTPAAFGPIYQNEKGEIKHDIEFYDTDFGRELKTIYNTPGAPVKFSYKFKADQYSERKSSDGRRAINYDKVTVYRVDPVDRPATPGTHIDAKSLEYREKLLKELENTDDPELNDEKDQGSDILDQDITEDINKEDEELILRFKFASAILG